MGGRARAAAVTAMMLAAAPVRADAPAHDMAGHLGTVHFATSCDPAVQPRFDHAMAWLHSFWTADAIADFTAVAAQDPHCAIAYWGIAMALQRNPLTAQPPDAATVAKATAALDRARAIGAGTPRERDYIEAADRLYRPLSASFPARREAYASAMQALAARYPDDLEAQILDALALEMTASPQDATHAHALAAAAILQKLLSGHPDHPGIAHYLLHAYDTPALASRGLEAARLYARIAPDHPHALHMPSHIFTRLGMWQESIDANLRSAKAAKAEGNGQEQAHAMDYLVYAYLQLGRNDAAHQVVRESASLSVPPSNLIGPYALAAMPAREAVEREAWTEAAALTPQPSAFPFTEALTRFARGLGMARLNRPAEAEAEAARLGTLRDAQAASGDTYWPRQIEAQRLAVLAWAGWARGDREHALTQMRAAADLEDSMEKHIVTPGAIAPDLELLGAMELQAGRPAEALAAYQASATREPNWRAGLAGLVRAASAAGDRPLAEAAAARLAALGGSPAAAPPP